MTMALFRTNVPEQCGIVTMDTKKLIVEFVEKPEKPKSNLANAGIYVANLKIFKYFEGNDFCEFGKDILPKLVGIMYGHEIQAYLRDMSTLQNLQLAQEKWTCDYL